VVDLVNETGQNLLAIDGILFDENAAKALDDCRRNDTSSTHDSTPKISHTLHASFRFFL
jgi:hypothetical protein